MKHKVFALLGAKNEVAIHHPRHAVVMGDGKGRSITGRNGPPPLPDLLMDVLSLLVPSHERVALELILHVEAATVSRQRSFEKLPVNRVVCGFLRHDV